MFHLSWLPLSAADYVVQGLLALLIFIVPWFKKEKRGGSVFLISLVAICLWGQWRMFYFDPAMKNDVPGLGYLVAALVYSLIARGLYQVAQWVKKGRQSRQGAASGADPSEKWTYQPNAPIVGYTNRHDEPMQEAYRLAAETVPDFIKHIHLKDGRFCAAKLSFKDPSESARLGRDKMLYWWLSFATYDAEQQAFSAEFVELPECLKAYHHIGQRLWFEADDIFDWYANDEGRLYGGFTMRVSHSRVPEGERAAYEQYIGVTKFMASTAP